VNLEFVLCASLLATPAMAQWERHIGNHTDVPPAHDLPFFEQNPCARGKAESSPALKEVFDGAMVMGAEVGIGKVKTELTAVGQIGKYTIYDLVYTFDEEFSPTMRSILVQTGPREYHEILVQAIPYLCILQPAEIVHAGTPSVILAAFEDGGMYRFPLRNYLVVGPSGASELDFSSLDKAEKTVVLPKGMRTWEPASEFDLANMLYTIGTELESESSVKTACCVGRIEIPFRIEGHRVIAGAAKYVDHYF
jgi:hypothetical protein